MVGLRRTAFLGLISALSLLPQGEPLTCWDNYTNDFSDETCIVFISMEVRDRWRLGSQTLANDYCRQLNETDSDWSLLTLDSIDKHEKLLGIIRNTMRRADFFYAQWLSLIRRTERESNWSDPAMWIWGNGESLADSFNGSVPWEPSQPDNQRYIVDQNRSIANMERCVVAQMRKDQSSPWFEWADTWCGDDTRIRITPFIQGMINSGTLTCEGKKLPRKFTRASSTDTTSETSDPRIAKGAHESTMIIGISNEWTWLILGLCGAVVAVSAVVIVGVCLAARRRRRRPELIPLEQRHRDEFENEDEPSGGSDSSDSAPSLNVANEASLMEPPMKKKKSRKKRRKKRTSRKRKDLPKT